MVIYSIELWVGGGGHLLEGGGNSFIPEDFSVSPSPLLGFFRLELGWDWVWGDWGLRGWGLGLDNR